MIFSKVANYVNVFGQLCPWSIRVQKDEADPGFVLSLDSEQKRDEFFEQLCEDERIIQEAAELNRIYESQNLFK